MHVRSFAPLALVVALSGLTGCSGGGSGVATAVASACAGAKVNALCLTNCSLACNGGRCELTEIAQNENVVLVFSQDVDPRSVSTSSIQFRSASGDVPVGEYLVNGNVVEFVPQVLVVGGLSFFGFRAGETYTMTLPAGASNPNALRSTSGDPLLQPLSCTLNVSRGIVDLNGVPPSARLVTPAVTTNVAFDTIIQLEFNELIDVTPFLASTTGAGPVVFALRRTRVGASGRECNPLLPPTPLPGSPRVDLDPARGVSVVTLRPTQPLPCDICVEITVTDQVKDLAGRPASPQTFQFITQSATTPVLLSREETFDDDAKLDKDRSAGAWIGGRGTFGTIGGDGFHGAFDPAIGQSLGVIGGKNTYQINTDSATIPAQNTLTGQAVTVTDGKFRFTDMVVPREMRLRFVGSQPPQFQVRGKIEIAGVIEVFGQDMPVYIPSTTTGAAPGQAGGLGGVMGGRGGAGGDRCQGTGALPAYHGQDGENVRVPAGHAYAGNVSNTRGRGSALFPADGQGNSVVYSSTVFGFAFQASAGGGGGGSSSGPGQPGRVISNTVIDPGTNTPPRLDFMGPQAAGGIAFSVFPIPSGARSSRHFLVGGAGGGGSGSSPVFANNITRVWAPGSGGAGGGGAIALRAGSLLRITADGRVLANGGSGGQALGGGVSFSLPTPGGGGGGGSVLLQSGDRTEITGIVDVRGGTGGYLNRFTTTAPPTGGTVEVTGGNGAHGVLRLEVPRNPSTSLIATALPAPGPNTVALLTERDDAVGFQSLFYDVGQAFGPEYVRYEIRAVVDGVPVTFSDDPSVGMPARFGSAPIHLWLQAGYVDQFTGQVDPNSLRPWRESAGSVGGTPSLADDALNAFRFQVLFNQSSGQVVEIDSIKVVYRFC